MLKRLGYGLLAILWLPAVASATPDIVMKDLQGQEHHLNEYIGNGKWVVVMVWAHDCPVCNAEVEDIAFFHQEHKDNNAMVLGISVDGYDNRDKARDFIDRHFVDFPNLITTPGDKLERLGAGPFIGTPTFYVFTPEGELGAAQVGPADPKDLAGFIEKYSDPASRKKAASPPADKEG